MSVSPPGQGASGGGLEQAARWTRITGAGGFLAFSLFLLVDVGLDAFGSGALLTRPPPPRALPGSLPGSPQETPAATEPRAARPTPRPEEAAAPLSSRQILIDLGPPRSEVFVDGRSVGRSPFVGQVKCRPGREISIVAMPERGFPIEEKRVCPP